MDTSRETKSLALCVPPLVKLPRQHDAKTKKFGVAQDRMSAWASRVAVVVGLTVLLAALLSSSGRLIHQPKHVTTIRTTSTRVPGSPRQVPAQAVLEATLGSVRSQVGSLKTLVARTQAASLALKERLRAEPSAAAAEQGEQVIGPKRCAAGCERHGNCNALTGECSCSLTHRGEACERPTMPACELDASGLVVNLSLLASEAFWWELRDVKVGDVRRTQPLHRWIGPMPCECVRQALAVFSLQNTPSPASWPDYIGHLELALQAADLQTRRPPHPRTPAPPPPCIPGPAPRTPGSGPAHRPRNGHRSRPPLPPT